MKTLLIQDSAGISQLESAIRTCDRIAVDTEFHTERRYRPELMLLQIATAADEVWLVDPTQVSPAPLREAMSQVEVLVHGGEHDLQILHTAIEFTPKRLFDTQIGAGLLGHHYPARLSLLASTFLDHPVDKSSTMTDWSARPLTRQQLRYAAEDAGLLFTLAAHLEAKLESIGRRETAWTASGEQGQHWLSTPPDSAYWLRWEVASRMSVLEWKTLGALREWREQLATKQQRPPHAVFPNSILIDLARRRPTSKRGLHANRRIHSSFIRHHGQDLLRQISVVSEETDVPRPLTVAERRLADTLTLWAEAAGAEASIAPKLLLPETLRASIARDGIEQLGGWRAPWTSTVQRFLSGESGLLLEPETGKLLIKDQN